jgi:hypothetical protein
MMLSKQWTPGWWVAVFFAVLGTLLGVASSAALASAPQGEIDVSPEATPEIRQVKPNQAAAGEVVTVVISGQNFSRGAYVSFSTPTVNVLSTRRVNATELEAELAVGKRAPAGTVSLYVSNPASVVAEAAFSISGGAAPATARPGLRGAAHRGQPACPFARCSRALN